MRCFILFLLSFFLISCGSGEILLQTSASEAGAKVQKLSISGSRLVDETGSPVQLKGMSTHGLQWSGAYSNRYAMKKLRDEFGHNVYRAAMYTDEGGYLQNPGIKWKVIEAVDAGIELGMYVIIDWHILKDRNPLWNLGKSKEFFAEMSKRFGKTPNVIYEICNEPNGGDVRWNNAIKPYADQIIPVIRENAPEAIVIVGTPTWSQDIQEAVWNPIKAPNVMYAVHFYAASHGSWLRNRIDDARSKGLAVFITEWGSMDASGNGGINWGETDQWMRFLDARGISWTNWSLSASWQTHSILRPGSASEGWTERDLTDNGKLIKRYSLNKAAFAYEGDAIHIVGDSIFTTSGHRIKSVLEQRFAQAIFDHSRQGAWTRDIKDQYARNRGKKKILILDGGGNDVFGNSWNCKAFNSTCVSVIEQGRKNQQAIFDMAAEDKVDQIVYLGLHYPSDSAYRKAVDYAYPLLQKMCESSVVPCVLADPRKAFDGRRDLLEWDGVHPNWKGTEIMADLIFESSKKKN